MKRGTKKGRLGGCILGRELGAVLLVRNFSLKKTSNAQEAYLA
jgi:hypothetical protein